MDINKEYRSSLKPGTLFDAWLSPKSTIDPVFKIEVDPVPGGTYRLHSKSPAGVAVMNGEFVDIVPNRKLVYSWQWEGSEESTFITVNFVEDDMSGDTHVVIKHTGFLSKESLQMHDQGWDHYFNNLERLIQTKPM